MTSQDVAITRVIKAIEAIREGGMVIMVDDEDRENEGDLVFAANHVSPEKINFMTKEARGLICLTLQAEQIDRLKLPMMEDSTKKVSTRSTAFTVSIEAREGVTTGISAADRAHTIAVAVRDDAQPEDIVVPGHIFPLKARPGGVLERAGHTEGSVDIARLAGLKPAAVICEIMNDDGTMARIPDLEVFSQKHGIPIVTIADLVTFRLLNESLIAEVSRKPVETECGVFEGVLFRSRVDGSTHFALIKDKSGDGFDGKTVDVRVHRQRPLVDVFGNKEHGGRRRVNYGLELLRDSDCAVFVYLMTHEADLALELELEELTASDVGGVSQMRPWKAMDNRMLGLGAQILRELGVRKMRVHMSQPQRLKGLHGFDLEVVDTRPVEACDEKQPKKEGHTHGASLNPSQPI